MRQPPLYFYPRPPRGGRHTGVGFVHGFNGFLSTPSARRATYQVMGLEFDEAEFLSTPSARRATTNSDVVEWFDLFLSTPSARRATQTAHSLPASTTDFYPRPPRGGRPLDNANHSATKVFLSTPSARRATAEWHKEGLTVKFLSTPSARRATPRGKRRHRLRRISIHALREEGDFWCRPGLCTGRGNFYPRPPRGGRHGDSTVHPAFLVFLSTPSARRAT